MNGNSLELVFMRCLFMNVTCKNKEKRNNTFVDTTLWLCTSDYETCKTSPPDNRAALAQAVRLASSSST